MDKEGIKLPSGRERVRCRVFKDNVRVKVIVTIPRIRTHTKRINFKYWLFIEYIEQNRVELLSVKSEDQLADMLTKPLPAGNFVRLCDWLMVKEMLNCAPVFQASIEKIQCSTRQLIVSIPNAQCKDLNGGTTQYMVPSFTSKEGATNSNKIMSAKPLYKCTNTKKGCTELSAAQTKDPGEFTEETGNGS